MYGFRFNDFFRLCFAFLFISLGVSLADSCDNTEPPMSSAQIFEYRSLCAIRGGGVGADWYVSFSPPNTLNCKFARPPARPDFSMTVSGSDWSCPKPPDPEPDLSAQEIYDLWSSCEVGKSSPLVIASPSQLEWLGGRPIQSLICDDPKINELVYFDSWDDYASGTNPKFVDWDGDSPNPKPDPDPNPIPDPDPTPTPPSKGELGGTITTNTTTDSNGNSTSTSDVDVSLDFDADFLTQEQLGNTIDDNYRKWRDGNLGEISQANYGLFNTLSDLESDLPNLLPTSEIDPSTDDFAFSFNVVAQCPNPYSWDLSLMGYTWTMTFYYTWICDFALAISYLVMASAYLSAGYIYLGLRR